MRVRSTVGAGDSMVAGVSTGLNRARLEKSIVLGVAAGTAAVLTEGTELCHVDAVDELMSLVTVD